MSMKALTSTIIKAKAMYHVIYVEENSPPIVDQRTEDYRLQDIPRESINEPFYCNGKPGTISVNELKNTYEKIAYWRKNLFLHPTGATGKSFINKMTRMINAWVYDTPFKDIALKAVHVMPASLLQKPSINSKSKDHLKSLERRFEIWKEGI